MTPLAIKVYKSSRNFAGFGEYRTLLSKAKCFDFSSVSELAEATRNTFSVLEPNGDEIGKISHGELLFCPEKLFWIEICLDKNPAGFLCVQVNSGIDIVVPRINAETVILTIGSILLNSDDTFSIGFDKLENENYLTEAAFIVAACLIILNAPYGIEKTEAAFHKGFDRSLRKAGVIKQLCPYTIIKLAKRVPADKIVGNGTPKAFHFVRSHLRRYENGIQTTVKAHWRGDPALGILKTDYKVRA